jgi:hypothetical protein
MAVGVAYREGSLLADRPGVITTGFRWAEPGAEMR